MSSFVDDDFPGSSLSIPPWFEEDPDSGLTVSVGSGLLTMAMASGSSHDMWTGQNNGGRVLQTIGDVDFIARMGVNNNPGSDQAGGILVIDSTRGAYGRLDQYGGATKVFFAYVELFGSANVFANFDAPAPITNLRLTRSGTSWYAEYSTDNESSYEEVTTTQTIALTVDAMGPWNGNYGSNPSFNYEVDFFYDDSPGAAAAAVLSAHQRIARSVYPRF